MTQYEPHAIELVLPYSLVPRREVNSEAWEAGEFLRLSRKETIALSVLKSQERGIWLKKKRG